MRKNKPINIDEADLEKFGLMKIEGGEEGAMRLLDCQWKRIPCGKLTCNFCGIIARDRLRHELKGEDPDDVRVAMADAGRHLKEALEMIKKDAELIGIDLENVDEYKKLEERKPETFPLYRRVSRWQAGVRKIIDRAGKKQSPWLLTEAGADLSWYSNTLLAKTFRQLSNRWDTENGFETDSFEFRYTGRTLRLVLFYLDTALNDLCAFSGPDRRAFSSLKKTLSRFAARITEI